MGGDTRNVCRHVAVRRALHSVALLAGLAATIGCGAASMPSATPGPTATTVAAAASVARTPCVGPGCPQASSTPTAAGTASPTIAPLATSSATIPATATATPATRGTVGTATPGGKVLYRADFRNWYVGEEGGQYPLRASVDPKTGEYHLSLTDPQGGYVNYRTAPENQVFKDFQLDMDLRRVAGPDNGFYGVVFRVQPAVPGAKTIERYLLTVSGDGFLTFNHIAADGSVTRVAPRTESPAIAKGSASNHLTVVCKGTQFTVSVNGQAIGTFTGPLATGGTVGVYAGTVPGATPNNIEVAFSNLVLVEAP